MAVKLHMCPVTFLNIKAHPCATVKNALDAAGIEYEIVKHPLANLLCFKDYLASLLLARFNNCCCFSFSTLALGCSVLPDLFGNLLGFFSTPSN